MKIQKDTAVTIRYKVAEQNGMPLDEGREPTSYLHGGYGNTFEKIEAALEGQEAGFQTTVDLAPEEAFGLRNDSLVRTMPKSEFPPGVKVGGQLEGRGEDGQPQRFYVTKIKGPVVHLDGNHPLAGKALRFTVKVVSVRAASAEEIAHGHVHGDHGHHH
ncbi:FKBP-type peptidyl-prolyl cis-trans isomerase [Uliginosibacterium sp. H1]|uniref:FKBP-type peptidyl-prolyl cis-trans isomerase n=1 Tax=Uliginosibacterium sp. H1 TaxID=3114757 RepID=UPI002E191268|nr:peptidylprolyl isomerase [Uliginosibacterium sp. H1]